MKLLAIPTCNLSLSTIDLLDPDTFNKYEFTHNGNPINLPHVLASVKVWVIEKTDPGTMREVTIKGVFEERGYNFLTVASNESAVYGFTQDDEGNIHSDARTHVTNTRTLVLTDNIVFTAGTLDISRSPVIRINLTTGLATIGATVVKFYIYEGIIHFGYDPMK